MKLKLYNEPNMANDGLKIKLQETKIDDSDLDKGLKRVKSK